MGNVETVTSPIPNQTWTVTWEQPYPTERPNFYRVTEVTDPLTHWVQVGYGDPNDPNDPNDPTLVTTVTEQADGQGNPNAVTTLEYWHDENDACARGQLRLVTDANGVQHLYEYDQWGYSKKLTEGLIPGGACAGTPYPVVIGPTTNNPLGSPTQSDYEPAGCWSTIAYDVNGNPTGTICWMCERGGEGWPRRLGDPPSPHWDFLPQFLNSAQYDNSGRPTQVELTTMRWTDGGSEDAARYYDLHYDNLGRPKDFTLSTNEHAGDGSKNVERKFDYYDPNDPNVPWYDADGRVLRYQGPDGQKTEYTYDNEPGYDKLGRPEKITRSG
ncbi:MAG TPA: RHS repeat domain-containing protein, partial [Phycisphaerae bacterium]|nr:RHS repeat domain-containing protein [Phycisphaerae bacterium]